MSRKSKSNKPTKKDIKRHQQRKQENALCRAIDLLDDLADDGEWEQFEEELEELAAKYPRNIDVLMQQWEYYEEQQNASKLTRVLRTLVEVQPDNVICWHALGDAATCSGKPAIAYRAYETILRRWPSDANIEDARERFAVTECFLQTSHQLVEPDFAARLELLTLHEESLSALNEAQFDKLTELGQKILARWPNFSPITNNLCLAAFLQGKHDEAEDIARSVLTREPGNFHALGNFARALFLGGQVAEGRAALDELLRIEAPRRARELLVKSIEALALFGDWNAIMELAANIDRDPDPAGEQTLALHFAGVAAAKLGLESQARRFWQQALMNSPRFGIIEDNLADLKLPPPRRNGAWAFPWSDYVPHELRKFISQHNENVETPAFHRVLRDYLDQHPQAVRLIELLYKEGDRLGRTAALQFAVDSRHPELLEAARQFAAGQIGSDQQRMNAASRLHEVGEIENPRAFPMWCDGRWTDLRLIGTEISYEPKSTFAEPLNSIMFAANEATTERFDYVRAEQLYREALELKPNDSTILYNLSAALQAQGKLDEARRLVREIYVRDPDYFFARLILADEAITARRYDEARDYLMPLMQLERMHVTEFRALYNTYLNLNYAQENLEQCELHFEMLTSVAPVSSADEALFDYWEEKIKNLRMLKTFETLASTEKPVFRKDVRLR